MTEKKPDPRPIIKAELVVEDFLNAAKTLSEFGDVTQAELRLRDALKTADASFGHNSRVVRRVLTALEAFYRSQNRNDAALVIEKRLELLGPAPAGADALDERSKNPNSSHGKLLSVRVRAGESLVETAPKPSPMPAEVRRACQILGLPLKEINEASVRQSWKRAISAPEAHPDLGGERELAILLNNSRDTILGWLDGEQSKLAKKFEHIVRHNI